MNNTDPDNSIDIPNSNEERNGFEFPPIQSHDRKTSMAKLVSSPKASTSVESSLPRTGSNESQKKLTGDQNEIEPENSISTEE